MTYAQAKLLKFITEFMEKSGGIAPSFDEMAMGIGAASKGNIHRLVSSLQEQGHISRLPARARTITVTPKCPTCGRHA